MSSDQQVNKRIAKNSIFLYIRMFVTMAIGLYASRVVLQVLGASDYGLYNVVGGVLTLFTMFSAALTVGTQRFLSYAIGEKDSEKLKRTFSIAFGLHVTLAAIILVLAETLGLWFLYTYLNIPDGRLTAAVWVYQFSIIGFLVNLVQVPFQSCLIAHERMNMYAYMSIYDAVMKLLIVLMLMWVDYDKLITYAFLIFAVNITSVLIYNYYCRKNFDECTFRIVRDWQLTKVVYVSKGKIKDVVVDIRKNSPTYRQYFDIELDDQKGQYLYIPKGFAHGFLSLEEGSIVNYAQTSCYSKDNDCGIDSLSVGYDWGVANVIRSGRDLTFEKLSKFNSPF